MERGKFWVIPPTLSASCIQLKQQHRYSQHKDMKVLLKEQGKSTAPYGASSSSAPGFVWSISQ